MLPGFAAETLRQSSPYELVKGVRRLVLARWRSQGSLMLSLLQPGGARTEQFSTVPIALFIDYYWWQDQAFETPAVPNGDTKSALRYRFTEEIWSGAYFEAPKVLWSVWQNQESSYQQFHQGLLWLAGSMRSLYLVWDTRQCRHRTQMSQRVANGQLKLAESSLLAVNSEMQLWYL